MRLLIVVSGAHRCIGRRPRGALFTCGARALLRGRQCVRVCVRWRPGAHLVASHVCPVSCLSFCRFRRVPVTRLLRVAHAMIRSPHWYRHRPLTRIERHNKFIKLVNFFIYVFFALPLIVALKCATGCPVWCRRDTMTGYLTVAELSYAYVH